MAVPEQVYVHLNMQKTTSISFKKFLVLHCLQLSWNNIERKYFSMAFLSTADPANAI